MTRVARNSISERRKKSSVLTNGVANGGLGTGGGNEDFFDEDDEEYYEDEDDEYFDEEFDGEEYYDEYDEEYDDAEVVDVASRRGSRFKFDSKGRKIGVRGGPGGRGGGGNPKLAQVRERFRRKFCGHNGQEEYEQSQRAKFGSRSR